MFTKEFKQISSTNVNIAGGKGASLGEMTQAGIAIPPGFVILASAFDSFLDDANLRPEIDAILHAVDHNVVHTIDDASEKIRAIIEGVEIPAALKEEIEKTFTKLDAKYVAVRSSATSEDSADAAWAGQLETYLNTTKKDLVKHIKKCWSSLFTPRAIFYRFEKGLHGTPISVAVVVQKMVNSEKSGIAFSVHPVTQDRNQLIIEAGFGLGEAIVSGQVTPDSYIVEKNEKNIIERNINSQSKMLTHDEEVGNRWEELGERGKEVVLEDADVLKLADQIIRIEKHYGFPVDVEWAYENNQFFITQSRPITTLNQEMVYQEKIDDYIFMWASAPIMPSYWATPMVFFSDSHIYPKSTIFEYFDGEVITSYMLKDEIEHLKTNEGDKYLDPKQYEEYVQKYEKEIESWWKWVRQIEKKDYSNASRDVLKVDIHQFTEYQRDAISYFGSTRPEFTYAAEQKLEAILEPVFGDEWADAFGIITTSLDKDDIQKELADWESVDKDSDEALLAHASKYPWLVFGQFDEVKVLEFLQNRKIEAHLSNSELQKKQEDIFGKLGNKENDARYLARFLQEQAIRRMDIKAYWAGSYFLARNLWKKVAAELSIELWDILKYITPPEIEQLLDGIFEADLKNVLEKRRKAYAISYEPNFDEIKIFSGDEAEQEFKRKIKPVEEGIQQINGQVASVGYCRGKVRKVISGDLDQLQKSTTEFQKGEILVTSMTQPNMMTIASRAAAIIADEGGITSHAAIIARELGIPCIVGCQIAMEVLSDGSEIEVDAKNGVVKVIDKDENDLSKKMLTLVKEHSREYSLFQVVSYCDCLDAIWEEIGYKPQNEFFLYEDDLVKVYHSPDEIQMLFRSIGKKAQETSFLDKILKDFNESFLEILPFLKEEKTVGSIEELQALYKLFCNFYKGIAYVWVIPNLEDVDKDIRDRAMRAREETEQYSSMRDKLFDVNLKKLFPEYGELVLFYFQVKSLMMEIDIL
jgi:phosphoenolpyruvate synthase/pyruvate phosphate dikinase